jgi:hypothetical protein
VSDTPVGPPMKRFGQAVLITAALPLYQAWYLAKYANTRQGWAKVGTAISFVPVFIFSTAIWAAFWVAILWALWRVVS